MTAPGPVGAWRYLVSPGPVMVVAQWTCLVCAAHSERWSGTREAAREHVQRTGHTVSWVTGREENLAAVRTSIDPLALEVETLPVDECPDCGAMIPLAPDTLAMLPHDCTGGP